MNDKFLNETVVCLASGPSITPDLRRALIATGSAELIEGNTWGDTFWGFDTNKQKGINAMLLRSEYVVAGKG
jgi:hypothetical protein